MKREELLEMLGLSDDPEQVEESDPISMTIVDEPEAELSDTVLALTDWDREQGNGIAKSEGIDEPTTSDFFGLYYAQRPEFNEGCHDGRRQEFIENMYQTETWRSLHESTRSNVLASRMAAATSAREFVAYVNQQRSESKESPSDQADREAMEGLGAAYRAVEKAEQDIQEMNDAVEAMGGCGEGGQSGESVDMDRFTAMYQRVRRSPTLKRICELAGRFRQAARAAQRRKSSHGQDEVVGIHQAGDIERLVPHELGMLTDEWFELDAMRRLAENQSTCIETSGVEKQDKGPIVVVVDESGSMSGDRICQAKALALTMGWIARHQKRWLALVSFANEPDGERLVLRPGDWDEQKLTDWLDHFYGGGTSMDVPLVKLPRQYWSEIGAPKGKTDIVLITDAKVPVVDETAQKFNRWKEQEQVRMISLVVADSIGQLDKVSDESHVIADFNIDQAGIQSCLEV